MDLVTQNMLFQHLRFRQMACYMGWEKTTGSINLLENTTTLREAREKNVTLAVDKTTQTDVRQTTT